MIYLLIITVGLLVVELIFSPRLEYARGGKMLLFYGRTNRKYIVLL